MFDNIYESVWCSAVVQPLDSLMGCDLGIICAKADRQIR
jgi:hypothetical protein